MQELDLLLILITVTVPLLLGIIFSYYFIAGRRKRIIDKLSQCRSDIGQAHLELEALLNRDRYIEYRTINLWVKKWSFLFPLLKDLKKEKMVDPYLDEKTKMLFRMFEKTYEAISERNEAFIQQ